MCPQRDAQRQVILDYFSAERYGRENVLWVYATFTVYAKEWQGLQVAERQMQSTRVLDVVDEVWQVCRDIVEGFDETILHRLAARKITRFSPSAFEYSQLSEKSFSWCSS